MRPYVLGEEALLRKDLKTYGFEIPYDIKDRRAIRNIINNMCQRCYNEKDRCFNMYGGRGITICKAWRDEQTGAPNYKNFFRWLIDNKWRRGFQIDRIDNNKGYGPDNCRIVEPKVNCRNRRSNHYITYKGERKSIAEWAEILGVNCQALWKRIRRGVSLEEAFKKPYYNGNSHMITYNGETKTIKELAPIVNVHPQVLGRWIKQGLSIGDAIVRKANRYKRKELVSKAV